MADIPKPPEDEFERFLRRQSNLNRLYREQAPQEPPAKLADAVRNAALEAVRQRETARHKQPGWFDRLFQRFKLPLAAMASGVLVMTISVQILLDKGDEGLGGPAYDQPDLSQPGQSGPSRESPASHKPATPTSPTARPTPALEDKALPFDLGNMAPPTPEQWLTDIRALLKAGKTEEAREELAAFIKAHPDHPVPDDLGSLLGQPPAQ